MKEVDAFEARYGYLLQLVRVGAISPREGSQCWAARPARNIGTMKEGAGRLMSPCTRGTFFCSRTGPRCDLSRSHDFRPGMPQGAPGLFFVDRRARPHLK